MGDVPLIAIVDDDESMRLAIKSLLISLGWAVHSFASAEEFLHSAGVNETSCLVLDIRMPGMSGIELQRVLRARGHSAHVIFISAYPDDRLRAQSLPGKVSSLSKPFDEQTLLQCLHQALESNRNLGNAR